MDKLLTVILGDKVAIRRGKTCGLLTGLGMTLLIIIYYVVLTFVQDIQVPTTSFFDATDFRNSLGLSYLLLYFSLLLIAVAGNAIGWLFIRPLATVLIELLPKSDQTSIWGLSSTLTWLFLTVLLTTPPLVGGTGILRWFLLIIMITLTAILSYSVGKYGARGTFDFQTTSREMNGTGGLVTGSLLLAAQTLLNVLLPGDNSLPGIIATMITFTLGLALVPILCTLPYIIINPLATLFSRINIFKGRLEQMYMITSAACWTLIGMLFLNQSNDLGEAGNILSIVLFAVCGACGGWAIGQLKRIEIFPAALK